ncbi:conserved hypothetical protein [uncultured Pleomorphomonas sp.]|uniref:DUF4258 domain-containing protein n=1 Tax=uncultured Pleomorphomonas sp. TaxID=442121 RepID=A0A212KZC3_9HYPH|nr:DUF4258 domain-containing protein [uncultured Pleomorphomonas sp.]SCM70606.1 conserved hypothetical protein [uncultured Pleomorphomonas sp.]
MVIYTRHALEVMTEREISPDWVERTLASPEADEPDRADPGLRCAFRSIPERDGRILRVVYSSQTEEIRIITAFFDRGRRR